MTATTTTTRTETGSQLVAALEAVWTSIRRRHPELPDVVIITGSGAGFLSVTWGHYGHDFWRNGRFVVTTDGEVDRERKPEMFVSGQTLGVGAVKTLQTMLHEAAHGLAAVRGVKDCSRQNRYHNARFRELAEELGLEFTDDRPSPTQGFSAVTITDATRESYADVIDQLDEAIALSMELPDWARLLGGAGDPGGNGGHHVRRPRNPNRPKAGYRKATCGCGRTIRVAPSVLEAAAITCGDCGEDFTLA